MNNTTVGEGITLAQFINKAKHGFKRHIVTLRNLRGERAQYEELKFNLKDCICQRCVRT